jgi:putative NADPH-quinone reductase
MNVLAVVGTNRRDGIVSRACLGVLEGARESGHATELINLYDFDIRHCRGCWRCSESGACVQEDDFALVYSKVREASVVVLGSPVYWGNVTAMMKVFFDRHMGWAIYNPKGASEFSSLGFWHKLFRLHGELRKFGPKDNIMMKKRFVLITASTLPFPYCYLEGEIQRTFRAMSSYVVRLRGKVTAKLAFPDTLFRFRPRREASLLQKARRIGRHL